MNRILLSCAVGCVAVAARATTFNAASYPAGSTSSVTTLDTVRPDPSPVPTPLPAPSTSTPTPARVPSRGILSAAVSDLKVRGLSGSDAEIFADRLRSELDASQRVRILSRSDMDRILQGAYAACSDTACARDLGRKLSVDRMVVGSIDRIGEFSSVRILVVDPSTGKVAQEVTQEYSGSLSSLITQAVPDLGWRLTGVPSKSAPSAPVPLADPLQSSSGERAPSDTALLRERTEEYQSTKRALFAFAAVGTGLFLGGEILMAGACEDHTSTGYSYEYTYRTCDDSQVATGAIMVVGAIPFAVLGTVKFIQTLVRGPKLRKLERQMGIESTSWTPYVDPRRRATGILASTSF